MHVFWTDILNSTLNVARHAKKKKKSEVSRRPKIGKPKLNLKKSKKGKGRASAAQAAERLPVSIPALEGCCNGSSRLSPPSTKSRRSGVKKGRPRSNVGS